MKPWEKHKDLLEDLYKKHKLKEVMDIMERERGFVACRRAYMKRFSRWGFRKNKKSQTARKESGSSKRMDARLYSAAELPHEPPEVATETSVNTGANAYNPIHKINGDVRITHRTELLVQGTAPTEVLMTGHQATDGVASPLDKFEDYDDLRTYINRVEGYLLLDEIKKKALLSGNPDPHFPAMSDYQQALGGVISGDTLIA